MPSTRLDRSQFGDFAGRVPAVIDGEPIDHPIACGRRKLIFRISALNVADIKVIDPVFGDEPAAPAIRPLEIQPRSVSTRIRSR